MAESPGEEDEVVVRGDVVPGRAFGVREVRGAKQLLGREMVALARVEHADEVVLARLADADGIRPAVALAVGLVGLAPAVGGLHLVVEAALPIEVVKGTVRREHVDEDGVRVAAVPQQLRVAEAPGTERMRCPAVGLRVAAGIEPRLLRRAVQVEDDEVVGVVVAVGIDVRVVVVRTEQHPVPAAGVAHVAEGLRVAAGRPDLGQAVVVAPGLPVVLHEDGIDQAVLRGLLQVLRGLRVVAAPLVEAHARAEQVAAGALAVAGDGAEAAAGLEGALRRGHERERRVVVGAQREVAVHAIAEEVVRRHVHSLHDREPIRIVRADVARGQARAAGVERELLRPLDDVAETSVDAERLLGGRANAEF